MKLTRKCLITAFLCIVVSLGISRLHINTSSASVDLPTDMPYVFVYPENIVAEPGQIITVTVGVYNLTTNIYPTYGTWNLGQPLPPYHPNGQNLYPLGFLIGFELKFSWDPNVLECTDYPNVTVPFETYPNPIPPVNFSGTLHQPVQPVSEVFSNSTGTFQLAKAHLGVNYFNGNGTLFQMTFRVKREGGSPLTLSNCKLAAPRADAIGQTYTRQQIPNQVRSGYFLTSGAQTRVYGVDAKASVGSKTFSPPVIVGENGSVKITIHNEGSVTDYYNLTLYQKYPNGTTSLIQEWLDKEINTTKREQSFEAHIASSTLVTGNHTFTANASILHASEISVDIFSKTVRVINASFQLQVEPLSHAYVGVPVVFDATGNTHSELTGYFTQYKWEIRESPAAPVRVTLTNSTPTASYAFPSVKNWTVSLIVTDNFGITYDSLRPATAAYKHDSNRCSAG